MEKLYEFKIDRHKLWILIILLIYKVFLEAGYVLVLANKLFNFKLDLNYRKYILGFFMIIIMQAFISSEKKPSTFILNFYMFIAMVPITLWYALVNQSALYYLCLVSSFSITAMMLRYLPAMLENRFKINSASRKIFSINKVMIIISISLMTILLLGIIATNGAPTITALNLKNAYEIRGENYFIQNKYLGYIYNYTMSIFVPLILAWSLDKKKYILSFLISIYIFIFFMYSGNKQTLFSIFLIIGTYFIINMKKINTYFFESYTAVVIISVMLSAWRGMDLFFSIFIRRMLILPAELKFLYYDFFSKNPKIGMTGIYPGNILGNSPYDGKVGNAIASTYLDSTDMNANTGFMAEGYERFGYMGILIAFLLFALMLFAFDILSKNTNYIFATTFGIYPMFILNDLPIISSILMGPMLILLIICLFYSDAGRQIKHGTIR